MPTDKRTHRETKTTSSRPGREPSVDKSKTSRKTVVKDAKESVKRRDDSKGRNVKENSKVSRDRTRDERKDRSRLRDIEKSEKPIKEKIKSKEIRSDKVRTSRSETYNRTESNHRSSRTTTKGEGDSVKKRSEKSEHKRSTDISRSTDTDAKQKHHSSQRRSHEDEVQETQKKSQKNLVKNDVSPRVDNVEESYEDDFEDYEPDFESEAEDDDSGVEEEQEDERTANATKEENIQSSSPTVEKIETSSKINTVADKFRLKEKENILLAMQAENKFVEKFRQKSEMKDDEHVTNETNRESVQISSEEISTNNFINFTSAKRRQSTQKAMSKSLCRKLELFDSNRISMSEMPFDVFDLPPVGYDTYIKIFGRSNAKQMYTQTNDDDLTEEIQTDDIEFTEKWTQHPALGRWCSGGNSVKNVDAEELGNIVKSDSARLTQFTQIASEVIISLLQEKSNAVENSSSAKNSSSNSSFNSSDSIPLADLPFRRGCPVTFVQFSTDEPQLLLTIHAAADEELVDDLPELGIICVWNIYQPLSPLKILSSYSQPVCSCFNPGKANLVFAGLIDGSVLLWDLREPSNIHRRIIFADKEFVLRNSTYSTAEILRSESHRSPVLCIRAAQMPVDDSLSSVDYAEQQLTFRVASLEEFGIIKLWTAIEMVHRDYRGTDSDLGLAPGSCVRLIRSQTIDLRQFPGLDSSARKGFRTFDLQFLPSDCNHLFIATDLGYVVHCDSHGGKLSPAFYKSNSDSICEIRSVVFSSMKDPICFLVGCSDGSIRLHSVTKERSAITWPNAVQGGTINSINWAGGGACIFYVMDYSSRLHVWDLSQNELNAMNVIELGQRNALSFHVNGRSNEALNKTFQVAIAFDDGSVEIHNVTPAVPQVKPTKVLSNLLQMS